MSWDQLNRANNRYQTPSYVSGSFVHCWAVPDILEQKLPIASRTSRVSADAF